MPLDQGTGIKQISLVSPSIRCGACIRPIEHTLLALPGVLTARVNLSARRIGVTYHDGITNADALIDALAASGVTAHPPSTASPDATDAEGRALLLRVGVAGFAAMNVMLLSISVWSGADAAMRDLLHWVSALIALPAVAYAGQPFFKSAARALARWRLNMDVPISLAVLLSALHSVAETAQSAEHAYFDAAIMLLFFLLIGRYLEHRSRHIARSAASELMAMTGRTARLITPDGRRETAPLTSINAGMLVEVRPGERIPVDGIIVDGQTELDRALISGESAPESASVDAPVHAGMLNLTGLISIKVTAVGEETLLAEIAALVDAAERGRGRYDRIADRAARLYAPLVHLLAAAAFLGWFWATTDARLALQIAVAVLIVTCPCALALAVPTVHTVTSRRLFGRGIFLKDGGELERLADIDMVAFDKTGTLTTGVPSLTSAPDADDACWPVAAALASASRHPCAVAIAEESSRLGVQPAPVQDVAEEPGIGVSGRLNGQFVRLGRQRKGVTSGTTTWLEIGERVVSFQFTETLRPDAAACCDALRRKGLDLAILSGDSPAAVKKMALATGIGTALGGLVPGEKLGWLNDQKATGRKVLMVGDGLNDGPALAAAHASISPVSATDVAKTAAGLVVTGDSLSLVNTAHDAALTARRRSLQSFAIAAGYNAVAIPLAASGAMTPLIAAAAMSLSSLLVILNALRPRRSA